MRTRVCLILFLLTFTSTITSSAAFAQHGDHASDSAPARLLDGLGSLHHPITTASPEAQRFFDQGLTLVYAFNHEEAIRSFRRAAELDPKAAMPWWGVALALGPNYNDDVDLAREKAAFDAIQKARSLAGVGTEIERAYITTLAVRYTDDPKPDLKKLATDYSHAMKGLSQRIPDDPDAATIYAESMMDLRPWGLWNLDGTPSDGTLEILAVLESVLARYPDHIGANHYYIHAVEASPHPAWALPSAHRLAALAPAAGHLVHMPSHIYSRIGEFQAAEKSNESAIAADRAYLESTGAEGIYPAMYYSHNLHFLAYSAMQAGNFYKAASAADALGENIRTHAKGMPEFMTAGFTAYKWNVLLRFHRYQELLASPAPPADATLLQTLWHYSRCFALALTKRTQEAEAEQKVFGSFVAKISTDQPFGFNSSKSIFDLANSVLDARIAESRGDRKAAIASLGKAVAVQDTLAYDEPPDWAYPVRESLGGALLRDGQATEAEKVFREDLKRNPRNGRSLFGLWQSLKTQGKTADADWAQRQFEDAWKGADVKLAVENL